MRLPQLLDGSGAERSSLVSAPGFVTEIVEMEASGGGLLPSDSPHTMSTIQGILLEVQRFVEGSDITKVSSGWLLSDSDLTSMRGGPQVIGDNH